jgi:HEPN domain-containing protein
LLDNGAYDGAYYLCGYAVECALKACIARRTQRHDFPPPRRVVERMYTHDLGELLIQSGLRDEFEAAMRADPDLDDNWSIIRDWSEESRYGRRERAAAEALYAAVADRRHGVLRWFRRYW